jgi:hypothetical protein
MVIGSEKEGDLCAAVVAFALNDAPSKARIKVSERERVGVLMYMLLYALVLYTCSLAYIIILHALLPPTVLIIFITYL